MSATSRIDELRSLGNNLLIILVTSGTGGLLGAITTMKSFDWNGFDLGVKIVLIVSSLLIVTGIILRQLFYCKSNKLRPVYSQA